MCGTTTGDDCELAMVDTSVALCSSVGVLSRRLIGGL